MEMDLLCSSQNLKEYTFISENWVQVLGWDLDELNAKSLNELVHPEDVKKTLLVVEAAKARTKIHAFENRLITKNKEIKFFEWQVHKVNESYICQAKEISPGIKLLEENSIEWSEQRSEALVLKQTIEELNKFQLSINQHCLVARLNSYGYFLDINRVFEKNSGYSLPEFIGKPFLELISDKKFHQQFKEIFALLRKGEKWRGELKLKNKNDSIFWVDMSMTPIMSLDQNSLSEVVCIGYDITEKKRNDERYKTVISGINAGIWDWPNIEQKEVYWSPRFFDLLKYDPSQVTPSIEFFTSMMHPEERAPIGEMVKEAMEKESNYLLEYRLKCGDGQYRWFQKLGIILRDDQGKPYRLLGSLTDINQKKLIEVNLEEEKQKTIQNSKLAILGEMAAGLAHEVSNPLTIIFGYIRILEEEMLGEKIDYLQMQKHIGLIKNAAQRAAKIVTNLKDFSRDGSGDPFTEITSSELIKMVLDLCSERFKKHGIKIELKVVDDPIIYCRKIEISQVLLNLLFNSFDAIENDFDKWVNICVQKTNQFIEIHVVDSGKGLKPELVERVFTPFFTTKKVGQGTGLGLSISQRIIMNHGGEIFYDAESKHTKFVVKLPMKSHQTYTASRS